MAGFWHGVGFIFPRNFKNLSWFMALTHCPMCQTSIATDEVVKSCSSCGADLSRWMPKPPPFPAPDASGQAVVEQGIESHRLAFGVLGAVVGACIGSGLMYGFYAM